MKFSQAGLNPADENEAMLLAEELASWYSNSPNFTLSSLHCLINTGTGSVASHSPTDLVSKTLGTLQETS